MNASPPSKEAVVLQLLAEGDVMLCLDTRCADVRVPAQHEQNPALRLILNLNFPSPIDVTAEGISANLSFGGRRIACYIPLDALWAAFDPQTMQGRMWPDSMPPEVTADLVAQQQQEQPKATSSGKQKQPTQPHIIQGKGKKTADGVAKKPRQRGHLKVIK
ncbi:MAG: ClpXP protease specificity-enhancing factor SspB [bacterium]|nr:ClpXP protease specificity-enhancing factor SspB [bacterium]